MMRAIQQAMAFDNEATKFYHFRQNNSGGQFYIRPERGISVNVIIEATSATHANMLAENLGLYFDGCADRIDCSCCGDRWYTVSEHDGDERPSVWGEPVFGDWVTYFLRWSEPPAEEAYVHFLDGRVVGASPREEKN